MGLGCALILAGFLDGEGLAGCGCDFFFDLLRLGGLGRDLTGGSGRKVGYGGFIPPFPSTTAWRCSISSSFVSIGNTTADSMKHLWRYSAQQNVSLPGLLCSTSMRVYGLPIATIRLLALVMAVLKTLGLHRLLVGLREYPDESSASIVLMKRARNSRPE